MYNPPHFGPIHIAVNQNSWHSYYQRDGRNFQQEICSALSEVASTDTDGFEPTMSSHADLCRYAHHLGHYGLSMRSIFINSVLHDPNTLDDNISEITAIVEGALAFGASVVVVSPNPVSWQEPIDKTDEQLETQAHGLNILGEWLANLRMTLAYHNHDQEMRCAAREFHHMMNATDPAVVSLCLEPHGIYRGAGGSTAALFDIIDMYDARICEVHLRQSHEGICSETFCEGDINYQRLANRLNRLATRPHLVIEQACEPGTPHTLSPRDAQIYSTAYARTVFADR